MKISLIFLVLLFLLPVTLVIAQIGERGKTTFAVLGGVNFQNFTGKNFSGNKLENDLIIGFHAGVNAQIPIVPDFYFQPGLMFSTKGAKSSEGSVTNTVSLSYVELPLNLVYKGKLGSGFVFIGFGPYIGYGISGKSKFQGNLVGPFESDVVFKNEVAITDPLTSVYFRPFDVGGNIFVGYEMAMGLFLQLNTQLGMIKINPDDKRFPTGETSVKNTGFGLSLGYRF
jgi:hypothetical protein